jgi:hypothetical protein
VGNGWTSPPNGARWSSLTLCYQHDSPGADKESSWVPAPLEEFSLYIRAYWPKKAILNGTWKPPLVSGVP